MSRDPKQAAWFASTFAMVVGEVDRNGGGRGMEARKDRSRLRVVDDHLFSFEEQR